jgi:hypothetical protein
MNDNLTSLVKKIDQATASHSDARMGSFVVMLSDDDKLEKHLKDLADKEKLQKIVLTIDNVAGPKSWKIAKEADVTVVLYAGRQCKANYVFKKGEMKAEDVDKIVGDVKKIVPDK